MQIDDVILGLAAGVGVRLSPDGKTAYYVEWSIGTVSKVEVATGTVTTIMAGLQFPQDVLVDWDGFDGHVRTGIADRTSDFDRARGIVGEALHCSPGRNATEAGQLIKQVHNQNVTHRSELTRKDRASGNDCWMDRASSDDGCRHDDGCQSQRARDWLGLRRVHRWIDLLDAGGFGFRSDKPGLDQRFFDPREHRGDMAMARAPAGV